MTQQPEEDHITPVPPEEISLPCYKAKTMRQTLYEINNQYPVDMKFRKL